MTIEQKKHPTISSEQININKIRFYVNEAKKLEYLCKGKGEQEIERVLHKYVPYISDPCLKVEALSKICSVLFDIDYRKSINIVNDALIISSTIKNPFFRAKSIALLASAVFKYRIRSGRAIKLMRAAFEIAKYVQNPFERDLIKLHLIEITAPISPKENLERLESLNGRICKNSEFTIDQALSLIAAGFSIRGDIVEALRAALTIENQYQKDEALALISIRFLDFDLSCPPHINDIPYNIICNITDNEIKAKTIYIIVTCLIDRFTRSDNGITHLEKDVYLFVLSLIKEIKSDYWEIKTKLKTSEIFFRKNQKSRLPVTLKYSYALAKDMKDIFSKTRSLAQISLIMFRLNRKRAVDIADESFQSALLIVDPFYKALAIFDVWKVFSFLAFYSYKNHDVIKNNFRQHIYASISEIKDELIRSHLVDLMDMQQKYIDIIFIDKCLNVNFEVKDFNEQCEIYISNLFIDFLFDGPAGRKGYLLWPYL